MIVLVHSFMHVGDILCCIYNAGGTAGFQQKAEYLKEWDNYIYANKSLIIDNRFVLSMIAFV